MQTERFLIASGAHASPAFRQAYTARGFPSVMRQKGYLIPHTQLQKEDPLSGAGAEEISVPLRRRVPALILHEAVVAAAVRNAGSAEQALSARPFWALQAQ